MNRLRRMISAVILLGWCLVAQSVATAPNRQPAQAETSPHPEGVTSDSGDIEQMRSDLERLKVLLNQMRTNLAFVQTSQTPLKHQFELEADAWQVIVDQMDRRLKLMEERKVPPAR
jgi:hypothetical protein